MVVGRMNHHLDASDFWLQICMCLQLLYGRWYYSFNVKRFFNKSRYFVPILFFHLTIVIYINIPHSVLVRFFFLWNCTSLYFHTNNCKVCLLASKTLLLLLLFVFALGKIQVPGCNCFIWWFDAKDLYFHVKWFQLKYVFQYLFLYFNIFIPY